MPDVKFNYVVGKPWGDDPNHISVYAFGSEIQRGTMKDAKSFLEYVKRQAKSEREPNAKEYGIYAVGLTRVS